MFHPGGTYAHSRMLDAVILVTKSFRDHKGRYHLRIRWFNNRGVDLGFSERVTITRDQLPKWRCIG